MVFYNLDFIIFSKLLKTFLIVFRQQIVHNALSSGIDLQAKGYVNPPPPKVGVYDYNTYGVSCVQSEIDVLTGEIQILRF